MKWMKAPELGKQVKLLNILCTTTMFIHHSVLLFVVIQVLLLWQSALADKSNPVKRLSTSHLAETKVKVDKFLAQYETHNAKVKDRTLVIFHIGDLGLVNNSADIMLNNLRIFVNSVALHSDKAVTKAFYIFNVVDQHNPILDIIPVAKNNVGVLKWNVANSDLDVHLRTLKLLGINVTDQFGSVIFTNQGVRGPLVKRKDGEWIHSFTNLLRSHNNGLIGPTLSCEVSPHVQTHMFALQTSTIPTILSQMRHNMTSKFASWPELIAALEVGLTGVVQRAGYNVSSFLYNNRGQPYFESGKCLKYTGPPNRFDKNPAGWCGVSPEELIFVKWGGETMRTRGMMCNTSVHAMETILEKLATTEPEMQLVVPESLMGGMLYPVAKEYALEDYRDRHPMPPEKSTASDPKVCFLVRARKIKPDNMQHNNPYSKYINKDISLLFGSLRRQTNPNWLAFVFAIDATPTDDELRDQVKLHGDGDPRLQHLSLLSNPYHAVDAGYTAVDAAVQRVLAKADCKYLSVTSSDNAYGSEVVARVLAGSNKIDMLLVPMDSHRYQQREVQSRNALISVTASTIHLTYCSMVENMLQTGFSYVFQPSPYPGRVDAASVFLNTAKFAHEKIMYSNFTNPLTSTCAHSATDPIGYTCLNRQAEELTQHLVLRKQWSFARLPLDGLKSVVFHGNSPTLCIASGDVWIDSAWQAHGLDPLQAMCITPKDALSISPEETFDREFFFHQDAILGYCLRGRYMPPTTTPSNRFWTPN